MKKFILILMLLPIFLFSASATLLPDYNVSESYIYVKGDTSGVTLTASAVDSLYIKNIYIGKYSHASLALFGDVDSIVIKNRLAPIQTKLASVEWDSLDETAATDSIKIYEFSDLTYLDMMDILLISSKQLAGSIEWYLNLGK